MITKLITYNIHIPYTTMSQLLSLGAINKLTGEYVYPKIANKKMNIFVLNVIKI